MAKRLTKPGAKTKRVAVTTQGRGNHAVRSGRYRYIRYAKGGEELYDHKADPNEWTNLAASAEFEAQMEKLAQWLPKENLKPAPKSAHRILTYDRKTRETIWQGENIKPADPIPELK